MYLKYHFDFDKALVLAMIHSIHTVLSNEKKIFLLGGGGLKNLLIYMTMNLL